MSQLYFDSLLGDDSNSGTERSPKRTIAAANAAITAVGRSLSLHFKAGCLFPGSLTLNGQSDIRAVSYARGPKPIISGGSDGPPIYATDSTGLLIADLELVAVSNRACILLAGTCNGMQVASCHFNGGLNFVRGVGLGAGANNLVVNCTGTNSSENGLHIESGSGMVLEALDCAFSDVGQTTTTAGVGAAFAASGNNARIIAKRCVLKRCRRIAHHQNKAGENRIERCVMHMLDSHGGSAEVAIRQTSQSAASGGSTVIQNCGLIVQSTKAGIGIQADLHGRVFVKGSTLVYRGVGGTVISSLRTNPGGGAQPGLVQRDGVVSIIPVGVTGSHVLSAVGDVTGDRNIYWQFDLEANTFLDGATRWEQYQAIVDPVDAESSFDSPNVQSQDTGFDPAQIEAACFVPRMPTTIGSVQGPDLPEDLTGAPRMGSGSPGAVPFREGSRVMFLTAHPALALAGLGFDSDVADDAE